MRMFQLPLVCFLGLVSFFPSGINGMVGSFQKQSNGEIDLFNFHEKTLVQFNGARRIIASGSLAFICKFINAIRKFTGTAESAPMQSIGPASNMYQMRWSRELEQIALQHYEKYRANADGKPFPKGYKGFVWMGAIIDLIRQFLRFLPEFMTNGLEKLVDFVEVLIIVFWMAKYYPTEPIVKGRYYNAAEALFASRYEIGCFSNIFAGICVVRDTGEEGHNAMFKENASCYECPEGSHCEYTVNIDGFYEEGELCVAPDPNVTMVIKDMNATTTMSLTTDAGSSASILIALLIIALIMFVKSFRR